jgi:holo-[acyl-carrier protein] synthase
VRFAAKEAVMKAMGLGLGRCHWRDIEVVRGPAGVPTISLSGAAARRAVELGVTSWHLSLSHCRAYAVAYAVAERGQER